MSEPLEITAIHHTAGFESVPEPASATFVPGPWHVEDGQWVVSADGKEIIYGWGYWMKQEGSLLPTAHLVSAAPDLLAACEASQQCITDVLEIYGRGGSYAALDEAVKSLRDDALRLTKIALAKATGEAPNAH